MTDAKLKASARARAVIAPLLASSQTPFKDYLKATDYCTAIMHYTSLQDDREFMAQWRAAFAALMVANDSERVRLLHRLRADFKNGRSPLPSLMPDRH
ncbi:hypothetical protein [Thiocystis violacea]|uniref:hypothetical protein n=1 Tax=Thiocystis violacea TaxID=13725 RepID=UPI0019040DFA|nr:hypothetical protein [Thiocystis violacea]MBK1721210.1 hypothetical protein [Thiocystis violacea]